MRRLILTASLLCVFCLPARPSAAQSTTTTTTAKDGSTVTVTVTRKKARRLSAKEIAALRKRQEDEKEEKEEAQSPTPQVSPRIHAPPLASPPQPPSQPPSQPLLTRPTPPPAPDAPPTLTQQSTAIAEMEEAGGDLSPKEMATTPLSLRLEANTDLPLHIGAGLLLETPARIRLRTGFGFVSKAYVSGANSLVQGLSDSYDEEDAALVESALGQSFLWRSQVGIRPFQSAGFYLHAGYSLAQISGSASGFDVVDAAFKLNEKEREAMMRLIDEDSEVAIDSRLHMLDAEVGWEWWPTSHVSLRMGLGWAYTFAAKAKLAVNAQATTETEKEIVRQIEEEGSQKLSELYTAYFHPPSLNIALGIRF